MAIIENHFVLNTLKNANKIQVFRKSMATGAYYVNGIVVR